MPDALEVRIAHLEGGYEQIDKRLSSLEATVRSEMATVRSEIISLRTEVRKEFGTVRTEMREQLRWILGFQIVTLLSLVGSLLAIFLRT